MTEHDSAPFLRVVRTDHEELAGNLVLLGVAVLLLGITLASQTPSQTWWVLAGYATVALHIPAIRLNIKTVRALLANGSLDLPETAVMVLPLARIRQVYSSRPWLVLYAWWTGSLIIGFSAGAWPGVCALVAGSVLARGTVPAAASLIVIRWERRHSAALYEPASLEERPAFYVRTKIKS